MRSAIAAALVMTLCACVGAKTQTDTGAQASEPSDVVEPESPVEPEPPVESEPDPELMTDTDGPESDPPGEVEVEVVTQPAAESYVACGCGCCGGIDPGQAVCVGSKAELDEIARKDNEASQSKSCAMAGCSRGTLYKICD